MARHGCRVQLELLAMRLALNMAKMANGGFLRATIEEIHFLIKKPRAKVEEVKKWGTEFPEHKQVEAVIERHLAILHQNDMPGCLPCHNYIANNP
jgi:hypothetical protein